MIMVLMQTAAVMLIIMGMFGIQISLWWGIVFPIGLGLLFWSRKFK
jgi:hypothetical protein